MIAPRSSNKEQSLSDLSHNHSPQKSTRSCPRSQTAFHPPTGILRSDYHLSQPRMKVRIVPIMIFWTESPGQILNSNKLTPSSSNSRSSEDHQLQKLLICKGLANPWIQAEIRHTDLPNSIAAVIPFWAKREESINYRNTLKRLVQDIGHSNEGERARCCICYFEMVDVLLGATPIHKISVALAAELAAMRAYGVHERADTPDGKSLIETSDSDGQTPKQLPIVFMAHSLGSWVVKDILSDNAFNNTSIMFDTRGAIFLDTPRDIPTNSEEDTKSYLKSLQPPSDNTVYRRVLTYSRMKILMEELREIDGHFEVTQQSKYIQGEKCQSPSIMVLYDDVWAIPREPGTLVFRKVPS